jgi:hypothetical protein
MFKRIVNGVPENIVLDADFRAMKKVAKNSKSDTWCLPNTPRASSILLTGKSKTFNRSNKEC